MVLRKPLCLVPGGLAEMSATDTLRTGLSVHTTQREFRSALTPMTGTLANVGVSGTAYWVYVGRTVEQITINGISLHVATAGAGAQTAEMALASTPTAPSRLGQTLTKLGASSSMSSLTTTGTKRPLSAFGVVVPAETHLWVGFRQAMATTQAVPYAIGNDLGQGNVLQTAAAGVLTAAGPWVGVIPTSTVGAGQAPLLIATLDF